MNADEDGPVEVCVPDAGDKRLPAGEVAFTGISGLAREIYLRGPAADEQLEIALPLA